MSHYDPHYHVPSALRKRFRLSPVRWAHLGVASLSLLPQIAIFATWPNPNDLLTPSYVLTVQQMTLAMTGLYLLMVVTIMARVSIYGPILIMILFNSYHLRIAFGIFQKFQGQGRIMAITFFSALVYLGVLVYGEGIF